MLDTKDVFETVRLRQITIFREDGQQTYPVDEIDSAGRIGLKRQTIPGKSAVSNSNPQLVSTHSTAQEQRSITSRKSEPMLTSPGKKPSPPYLKPDELERLYQLSGSKIHRSERRFFVVLPKNLITQSETGLRAQFNGELLDAIPISECIAQQPR